MPVFRVFERADAIRIYKVEAKDEAEAKFLVEEAEVDFYDQDFIEFDVFEIEEITE